MSLPYVLLIEDNLADAELTRAALSRLEVDVEFVHAYGGEEGLAQLSSVLQRESPPRSILVLLDLSLPGIDGFEVLRRFRDHPEGRCIPIVVFSGTQEPSKVRESLEQHANLFLHKPDDVDVFLERVRHITETFLLHAASPINAS